ncbi:MAG: aconitate hydratase 2/2-methylisocitrate dehydratase, partial [bacterium]
MLEAYRQQVIEREAEGVVPQPLSAAQTVELVDLLKAPPEGEGEFLVNLLSQRIPAGVDEAAYVKAGFLAAVAKGDATSPLVSRVLAVELLGTMLGGYNIQPLIAALDDADLADAAAKALSHTLLMFDAFHDVEEKAKAGNAAASQVMQSWADADWFLAKDDVPEKITVTVFKVPGETNTDDLSPATDAWSRPDIPLHAQAMLKFEREGVAANPLETIATLKEKGFPVAYVGDVVGTGSSRKSATNSVLWHMGDDIPYIPNRRDGGFVLGSKIAPIFYNTLEDAGALPIECDINGMETGDVIDIFPVDMKVTRHDTDDVLSTFEYGNDVLLDEVRAGGRIPLIIGRGLTDRARESLGLEFSTVFRRPGATDASTKGFTLAQKIVGKACGIEGVRPGQYCEPKMTTVGSQDTTGPMTRDE